MLQILSLISEKFPIGNINIFLFNLVLAVILFVVGIFLGKIVKVLLRKLIKKSGVERTAKKTLIELFLTVIKWSIYILFISLALNQLGIPQLTNWLTSILVVIPALVGALLLIAIGFAIAIFLRGLIEDSRIEGWQTLSSISFYFIIYVFMIFALKTALISQDKSTVNLIIIILTAVIAAGVTYQHVKKK